MYTIHNGINGGWYGSVTVDDIDTALAAARSLAEALAELRTAVPRPARSAKTASDKPALNAKGSAALAYLTANPKALHDTYAPLGHTQRTIEWLIKHGFVRFNPGVNTWTIL